MTLTSADKDKAISCF